MRLFVLALCIAAMFSCGCDEKRPPIRPAPPAGQTTVKATPPTNNNAVAPNTAVAKADPPAKSAKDDPPPAPATEAEIAAKVKQLGGTVTLDPQGYVSAIVFTTGQLADADVASFVGLKKIGAYASMARRLLMW